MEKVWWKDYTDQSILAWLKILNKRQQDSTDIVFLQNFDQEIIFFKPESSKKVLSEKENSSTHTFFLKSFDQETI